MFGETCEVQTADGEKLRCSPNGAIPAVKYGDDGTVFSRRIRE
jgi:hypothetical protein